MTIDTLPTRKPPYRDVFTKDRTRRTPVILSDGTSVEYPAGWDKNLRRPGGNTSAWRNRRALSSRAGFVSAPIGCGWIIDATIRSANG